MTYVSNFFQFLATFIVKKILPCIQSKPMLCHFKTVGPCPVTGGPDKKDGTTIVKKFLKYTVCPAS